MIEGFAWVHVELHNWRGSMKAQHECVGNYTNPMDLWAVGKSAWGYRHIRWINKGSARVREEPHKLLGSMTAQQEYMGLRGRNDRLCRFWNGMMSIYHTHLQNIYSPDAQCNSNIPVSPHDTHQLPVPNWIAAVMRNRFSFHNGLHVDHSVLSIGVSGYSTNFAQVLAEVRLTLCIYIEWLR